MHSGGGKATVGGFRLIGEIDDTGDNDGGSAVIEEIDFLGELRVDRFDLGEQVGDRPGNAVAFRLARDYDGIVVE